MISFLFEVYAAGGVIIFRQRCTGNAVCLVRLCIKKTLRDINLARSKEGQQF